MRQMAWKILQSKASPFGEIFRSRFSMVVRSLLLSVRPEHVIEKTFRKFYREPVVRFDGSREGSKAEHEVLLASFLPAPPPTRRSDVRPPARQPARSPAGPLVRPPACLLPWLPLACQPARCWTKSDLLKIDSVCIFSSSLYSGKFVHANHSKRCQLPRPPAVPC